jgi:hypothetical protein
MKKRYIVFGILILAGLVFTLYFLSLKNGKSDALNSPSLKEDSTQEKSVSTNEGLFDDFSGDVLNDGISEGPGGCKGVECNDYCRENTKECDKWCGENPQECEVMMGAWGNDMDQPQPEKNQGPSEGDGVWEKNQLMFFIKDEENILSDNKRKIIQDAFNSNKKSNGGYWGWNSALQEINNLYPDNKVPDIFIEIYTEENADFIISVHSEEEYCCDYGGDPVKGRERSEIDENFVRIKSRIWMYDVIDMEDGFLGDIFRHEVGHGIGIFGHVTNRNNDLMSIVSPASVIKRGNLDDLYIKYRDRIIESNEEAEQKDIEVKDQKVSPP